MSTSRTRLTRLEQRRPAAPACHLLWSYVSGGAGMTPHERETASRLWERGLKDARQARVAAMATDANACWVCDLCADAGIAPPAAEQLAGMDLVRLILDLVGAATAADAAATIDGHLGGLSDGDG